MTLPGLSPAAQPPPGYVFCVHTDCTTLIWKPDVKRPRCLRHQRLQRLRRDLGIERGPD